MEEKSCSEISSFPCDLHVDYGNDEIFICASMKVSFIRTWTGSVTPELKEVAVSEISIRCTGELDVQVY